MADCVSFPDNIIDFIDDYSFEDSDHVYTNGSKLISSFRVKQAIEHYFREQEPCVLTLNEVERTGANNFGAWSSEDLTILWIEEFGKNYGIAPVVAKWDEDDWNGEPNDIVCAYYFGSDLYGEFNLNKYNRTWRLWTDKPTETQRMGAAWDA